jgi:hypothetical protein
VDLLFLTRFQGFRGGRLEDVEPSGELGVFGDDDTQLCFKTLDLRFLKTDQQARHE